MSQGRSDSALGPRRWAPFLVRAGATAAILAVLLSFVPVRELAAAVARISLPLWLGAVACFLVGHVVTALKWRLLVRAAGADATVGTTLRAHFAGLFANLCLPSLVGGDVIRAGMLIRGSGRAEAVVMGGVADRVLDTAGLVSLAAAGALVAPELLASSGGRVLLAVAVTLFVGTTGALVIAARVPAERFPVAARPAVEKAVEAIAGLRQRPQLALAAFAIGLAVQSLFVMINARLGHAVGIDLPLHLWFFAFPLAKLAGLLPVSLGGLGVREAALAGLLAPFGVLPALAVAQSLLWQTILIASGLVAGGGALWLTRPSDGAPAPIAGETT